MKIEMEPTAQLVQMAGADGRTQICARVWKGRTANGLEVQVLVAQVAARSAADQSELQLALFELHQAPLEQLPPPRAFPLRMVI